MAESPPRAGAPDAGDEANEGAPKKKKGESDPLFHPSGLKKRTTVMGLAPAPHLGGLSGSPGAAARAEAEARKQRIASRLSAAAALSTHVGPPSAAPSPKEEIIEPLPPPYTGPPPPAHGETAELPAAVEVEAEVVNNLPPPAFGTTTLLMTPQTPQIPLTLPAQGRPPSENKQAASEWEVAPEIAEPRPRVGSYPGAPSEGTVLIEQPRGGPPPSAYGGPHSVHGAPPQPHGPHSRVPQPPQQPYPQAAQPPYVQQPYGQVPPHAGPMPAQPHQAMERSPLTERMLRTATPNNPVPVAQAPQNALALRPYEPTGPQVRPPGAQHALSGPLDPRLVLLADPDSPRAASFRVLRDSLLAKNVPRVLAVTSAAPHDGKTTCAINLALALAEQPQTNVLLIDANFFEPELATVFTLDKLTPFVNGDDWLAPWKLCAVTPSLHVAGMVIPKGSPGRRFEQHRFEAMIDRLCRASYDYLVIDTPALRGSPAVTTLVSGADGVLFAVRSGGTTGRELKRVVEQLPAKKALGVALIDA